jgi:hypothetical protein
MVERVAGLNRPQAAVPDGGLISYFDSVNEWKNNGTLTIALPAIQRGCRSLAVDTAAVAMDGSAVELPKLRP